MSIIGDQSIWRWSKFAIGITVIKRRNNWVFCRINWINMAF